MASLYGGIWDGTGQDSGSFMALTASNLVFSLIKLHLKRKGGGHSVSCGERLKTSILWAGVFASRWDTL